MSDTKKPDSQTETQASALEDAEIDKIMSEIEELQHEMNRADEAAAKPKKLRSVGRAPTSDHDNILKEFQSSAGDHEPSMDEMLGDLKDEASGPSLLDSVDSVEEDRKAFEKESEMEMAAHGHVNDEITHDSDSADSQGSMTLSMSGSMTLRLNYEIEGQVVTIGFMDQILTVELADGTEFKIPLRRSSKAA